MRLRHPHFHLYTRWGKPVQFFQFRACKICGKIKSRMVV